MSAALRLAAVLVLLGDGGIAVAQARDQQSAVAPTPVGIRLVIDRSIASKRIVEKLKLEAESLWAPYGIQLAWVEPHAVSMAQPSIDVLLDRNLGQPEEVDSRPVLGHVLVDPNDRGPHPIHLSFRATWTVLQDRTHPTRMVAPGLVPDNVMARVLGRVLAHEIGHVLIGAKYHDRDGLMRSHFTTDQLADPDRAPFHVTCRTMERLQSGLRSLTRDQAPQ